MLVIKAVIHKILVRIKIVETLIRQILQKQSDQGLRCLSQPFLQTTSVGNFRAFRGVMYTKCGILNDIYQGLRVRSRPGPILSWRLIMK